MARGRQMGAAAAALAASCAPSPGAAVLAACLEATPAPVFVPPGETVMGSHEAFAPPEERPARRVAVAGFWIDAVEVSNAQFAAFVAATGYVTEAERPARDAPPEAPAYMRAPGAAVFTPPGRAAAAGGLGDWWRYTPGANWRHPSGPGSSIEGLEAYPVVNVTLADAQAYAAWAGGRLPTEEEWERAARAGGESVYIWGDAAYPEGRHMANTWQGAFPVHDSGADGAQGAAPVGCYPPNEFGLYDMAGNVWELTLSAYAEDPLRLESRSGFVVVKGGSFLCAPSYCGRFRPAARQAGDVSLGSSHTGFRLAYDWPAP